MRALCTPPPAEIAGAQIAIAVPIRYSIR